MMVIVWPEKFVLVDIKVGGNFIFIWLKIRIVMCSHISYFFGYLATFVLNILEFLSILY